MWIKIDLDFDEIKLEGSGMVPQIPGKDNTIPSKVSVFIAIFC
jgi:hypothetical protein